MRRRLAELTFDVRLAEGVPIVGDPPPGEERRFWSPISATLISGELVSAEPLDGRTSEPEAPELAAFEVGHTDTDYTTKEKKL